jgi:hypothetical protein
LSLSFQKYFKNKKGHRFITYGPDLVRFLMGISHGEGAASQASGTNQ